jgi:hypothetical protein
MQLYYIRDKNMYHLIIFDQDTKLSKGSAIVSELEENPNYIQVELSEEEFYNLRSNNTDTLKYENGEIKRYAARPSFAHHWDNNLNIWILDTDLEFTLKSDEVRDLRLAKLNELDKFTQNPLRWESLSDDFKNQLSTYRQALLDVPQQEGFPLNIVWPESPL